MDGRLTDPARPAGTVLVLADDLIWASRLEEAVRRAGGSPARLSTTADLDAALSAASSGGSLATPAGTAAVPPRVVGAVVDLFARRYDAIAAVRALTALRLPVLAVTEHDDAELRRAALDAGALRAFSYNKLFTDGPRLIDVWLSPSGGRS